MLSYVFGPLLCYLSFITYRSPVQWGSELRKHRFSCAQDTKTRYVERDSRTLWPLWEYLALWLSSLSAVAVVKKFSTQTKAQTANLHLNTRSSSPDTIPHLSSIAVSLPHALFLCQPVKLNVSWCRPQTVWRYVPRVGKGTIRGL